MLVNGKFYIKDLKYVVFLGFSSNFNKLKNINKNFKIKTFIITSEDQAKLIKEKVNYKTYNKIDESFKNFVEQKVEASKTVFISLGARYIFKEKSIRTIFKGNLVNFHSTRLPYDAGGADVSWKILRQDRIDNQLCHLVDSGLDTGPIIDTFKSLYPKKCTIPKDFIIYKDKMFLKFYINFIEKLSQGKYFITKEQLNYTGRYNPRLDTNTHGLIDWRYESYDLINFINAFDDPYSGASTYLNSGDFGRLHIKNVHLHAGDSSNHPYMAGIVSRHDGDWIVVSTASKHMLLIEKVINSDGKNVINEIKVGDRFHTPASELDQSKKRRITYGTKGIKVM